MIRNQPFHHGLLEEINRLHKENSSLQVALQVALQNAATKPAIAGLAAGSEAFKLSGTYTEAYGRAATSWAHEVTWDHMLYLVGPELLEWQNDQTVNRELATSILLEKEGKKVLTAAVDEQIFKSVRIQMIALDYLEVKSLSTAAAGMALFWALTATGRRRLMEVRTVKTAARPGAV